MDFTPPGDPSLLSSRWTAIHDGQVEESGLPIGEYEEKRTVQMARQERPATEEPNRFEQTATARAWYLYYVYLILIQIQK